MLIASLIIVQVVIAAEIAGIWSFLLWKKEHWAETWIVFVMAVLLSCMVKTYLMQEMTRKFNDEKVCRNLYHFLGEKAKEYLPHGVTEN